MIATWVRCVTAVTVACAKKDAGLAKTQRPKFASQSCKRGSDASKWTFRACLDICDQCAAVVNTIGPIRQLVRGENKIQRRYLVIVPGTVGNLGAPVQVQAE